jgi:hypothetical protein
VTKKYDVFGKSVVLGVDNSEVIRKVEDSLNDAIREAYRNGPTARVTKVWLNVSNNDCYVSIEVTP